MKTQSENLSKNQIRSQETITKLLEAAEKVFIRDGYELAQLAEIASEAGRSKGALYGHFKSKEDLFVVLVQRRVETFFELVRDKAKRYGTKAEKLQAVRNVSQEILKDRDFAILSLEFRLYSLRHPESAKRLQDVLELTLSGHSELIESSFGKLSKTEKSALDLANVVFGPIVYAMVLESHFQPQRLSEATLKSLLNQLIDALYTTGISRKGTS